MQARFLLARGTLCEMISAAATERISVLAACNTRLSTRGNNEQQPRRGGALPWRRDTCGDCRRSPELRFLWSLALGLIHTQLHFESSQHILCSAAGSCCSPLLAFCAAAAILGPLCHFQYQASPGPLPRHLHARAQAPVPPSTRCRLLQTGQAPGSGSWGEMVAVKKIKVKLWSKFDRRSRPPTYQHSPCDAQRLPSTLALPSLQTHHHHSQPLPQTPSPACHHPLPRRRHPHQQPQLADPGRSSQAPRSRAAPPRRSRSPPLQSRGRSAPPQPSVPSPPAAAARGPAWWQAAPGAQLAARQTRGRRSRGRGAARPQVGL